MTLIQVLASQHQVYVACDFQLSNAFGAPVHKIDRLARNRYDDVVLTLAIREAGAQLVSVTENIDETPQGKLMHGIMASMAEFYSANLAAEILKGSVQKAKEGGTPYKAPLGYCNVRRHIDRRKVGVVQVDPETAPHIKKAFELYATGDWTLKLLLAHLTERGLRMPPTAVNPGKPVSPAYLARLLANRYYIGYVTYQGVEYKGLHESLIDVAVFDAVQDVLASHSGGGLKTRRHTHYLKGVLACARCGSRMQLTQARGMGGTYLYYFCTGRKTDLRCNLPYLPSEIVEVAVERYYRSVQLPDALASDLRQRLARDLRDAQKDASETQRAQATRITRLQSERSKLLQAHYAGAIPLELLKSEQERISREVATAEAQLEAVAAQYALGEKVILAALDLSTDCHRAYLNSDDALRRQLNLTFFEKIFVDDGEVVGSTLASPFAELYDLTGRSTEPGPQYKRTKRTSAHFLDRGSNKNFLVALTGTRSHSRDAFLRLVKRSRHGQRRPDSTANRPVQLRLSSDDVDRLVAAYEAGGRTTELAMEFGIHRNTVQRLLSRHGVQLSVGRPELSAGH